MTMYDRLRTIDRTSLSSVRMKHSSFAAFIWICLFGAVIAGCFSACGRKNSSTGAHALSVLKYPIIEEPPTLDPARLQQMREASRKTAQKRFCSTLVLPQYVKFYESLLADH